MLGWRWRSDFSRDMDTIIASSLAPCLGTARASALLWVSMTCQQDTTRTVTVVLSRTCTALKLVVLRQEILMTTTMKHGPAMQLPRRIYFVGYSVAGGSKGAVAS